MTLIFSYKQQNLRHVLQNQFINNMKWSDFHIVNIKNRMNA